MLTSEQELKGNMLFTCFSFKVPFDGNQAKASGGSSDPSVSSAKD